MNWLTIDQLRSDHEGLLSRGNEPDPRWYNGIYTRYRNPVVTADHRLAAQVASVDIVTDVTPSPALGAVFAPDGRLVVTSGGILGKVTETGEQFLTVEIAEGVKVKVIRSTITQVVSKTDPAPAAQG